MLAARDQENLVYGLQAAAASKPMNQGTRQLPPKTPSNKVPKTPFKLPLNDENGTMALGCGKMGLKTGGKGNENIVMTGKKGGLGARDAFITPMGPRTRAPLGAKTTNAKAKAFQTPAPAPLDNDLDKQPQKSATARKAKPRVSHAEMMKLEIMGDKEELGEREIEYMPPPVKDLPYLPDDMPHDIDLSMFENGGLTRNYMQHFMSKPDAEGMSFYDRQELEAKKDSEWLDKRFEAMIIRDVESIPLPCTHSPECPGEDCRDAPEQRRKAEEKFKKTMAALEPAKAAAPKATVPSKSPSAALSKHAASALSQAKSQTSRPNTKSAAPKSRLPSSLISSRKRTPPPTNPSPMRHSAAAVASRNTMGYSKGRVTSATLRTTLLPQKNKTTATEVGLPDTSLSPALYIQKYGVPKVGSEMWLQCYRTGCFDEDDGEGELRSAERLQALFKADAEEEFEFTL